MCLDDVKIYGNNPKTLLNKINENNEMKIIELPKFLVDDPISGFNSLCKYIKIELKIKFTRDGTIQNE